MGSRWGAWDFLSGRLEQVASLGSPPRGAIAGNQLVHPLGVALKC